MKGRPGIAGVLAVVGLALSAAPANAATISVNITGDTLNAGDGNCSLREAVTSSQANSNVNDCADGEAGNVDVISLDTFGTYQLTGGVDGTPDDNLEGDLDFGTADAGVVIQGDIGVFGLPGDVIDGGDNDRVLDFIATAPATVDTAWIQDGNAGGSSGGGIQAAAGALTIIGTSILTGNDAGISGGAVSKGAGLPLKITNAFISGNTAGTDNAGTAAGGGIVSSAPTSIERSLVSDNTVTQAADAVFDSFNGGGIALGTGISSITNSTIDNNHSTATESADSVSGGGISIPVSGAQVTIRGSTVSGNDTVGTSASSGTGIRVASIGGSLDIVNSTISGNVPPAAAAGTPAGGLEVAASTAVKLVHSTVAVNAGAGDTEVGVSGGGTVELRGTIIQEGSGTGCTGAGFTADAFNVDAGTSCVGAGPDDDLPNATTSLANLAFVAGSPTQVRELFPSSDAIDAVPASACKDIDGTTSMAVDQRGAERPFGSACDAGSFEVVTCGGLSPTRVTGPGNDLFTGTAAVDVIVGSAGDDTLDGAGGADFVCGGSGADTLLGVDGAADLLDCGVGSDGYRADGAIDSLIACETDLNAIAPRPPAQAKKCRKGFKLKKVKTKRGKKKKKCVKRKRKKKK